MPENRTSRFTPLFWQIAAVVLWLASGALGLLAVYALYNLTSTIYALFGNDYYTGVLAGQVVAVLAGLAWIIFVVVSGEYQIKHSGQRSVWKLFAWILGIEAAIILLGMVFG